MKYLRAIALIAIVAVALLYLRLHVFNSSSQPNSATTASVKLSPDTAASVAVVVNKGRILPAGYVPANLVRPNVAIRPAATTDEQLLRQDAASAIEQMFGAAAQSGAKLMIASGYRSYATQQQVYDFNVHISGASADETSARPGHSEHQTGLAVDLEPTSQICEIQDCFADTSEGKWLAANSYLYGFILRYSSTNQSLTGYSYEPWHFRYVGQTLAAKIHASNQTLEQYFGLPSYLNYAAHPYQLK